MTDVVLQRWRTSEDGVRYWYEFREPKDRPCARCPWLAENHAIVEPQPLEADGAYLPSTRADIWWRGRRQDGGNIGCSGGDFYVDGGGLADGGSMACHTRRDEKLIGPAEIAALRVCECTGARVLLDREVLRYVQPGSQASALSAKGARIHATFMLGLDKLLSESELLALDWRDLAACASPSLADPRIRFEDVAPPSEQELRDWNAALGQRAA